MRKCTVLLCLLLCLTGCASVSTHEDTGGAPVSYNEGEVVYKTDNLTITTDDVINCLDSQTGMSHQLTLDNEDLGDLDDYTYGLVYRMCLVNYLAGKYGVADITDYYGNLVLINKGLHLDDNEESTGKLYLVCFDEYTEKEINEIISSKDTSLDVSNVSFDVYNQDIDEINEYMDSMVDGISEVFHLTDDNVSYVLVDTSKASINALDLDKTTTEEDVQIGSVSDQLKDLAKDFTFDNSGFKSKETTALNEYIANYNYSSKREDVYELLAKEVQLWE